MRVFVFKRHGICEDLVMTSKEKRLARHIMVTLLPVFGGLSILGVVVLSMIA